MATPSTMVPLGTQAPDFSLPDTVSGQVINLDDYQSDKATVIMFICNHCPYVLHIKDELANVAKDYQLRDVAFIAISSNDIEQYPADAPDKMKEFADEVGFTFPYLYDETQEVAQAYSAACTPDFFVFDGDLKCVYRGQFDDARPRNSVPITGQDLRAALDAVLAGEKPVADQKPSMGCSIKWKK